MKILSKKLKPQKVIAIITCLLIVTVGTVIWRVFKTPQHKLTDDKGVIIYSTDKPDEKKPDKNYRWQGNQNDPKKIKIPSIGVDAYIQKVGVDQNKQVAVPSNLFMAGWFVDTVQPGKKGLSLIDGHVTGRKNDGVFKELDKLKSGDQFSLELGNGDMLKYEVVGKQSVNIKDSISIMFSQDPNIPKQLNLVTCSGNFDQKTRTYDERLIVLSKQL